MWKSGTVNGHQISTRSAIFGVLLGGILPALASATTRTALTSYFKTSVKPGDTVCELIDAKKQETRCFVAVDWSAELTAAQDPSGRLKKGAANPGQGQFDRVQIRELISSVNPTKAVGHKNITIYVKVSWQGQRAGNLGIPLQGEHVVRGLLKTNDQGQFEFRLEAVPDLTFIGQFNPTLAIAEIFGRNAATQISELEHDTKWWLEGVLNAVLPAVFESKPTLQPRP